MDEQLKQDFPIEWSDDGHVSRREFFKFMTVASGGLALGSVFLAAWSSQARSRRQFEPMRICSETELQAGQFLAFAYPRPTDPCILIRRQNGEIAAFSRRCTHLSCPVIFQQDKDRLYCPCHNGAFSANTGEVLQGPPPLPLPRIEIEQRGDTIWATGVKLEGQS